MTGRRRRIIVTVGTHGQPFDRLVSAAATLAARGHDVWVQRGASRVWPRGCRVADLVEPGVLASAMAGADAVVCHAGPATIFLAREHGHVPVVVPRDPLRGEHVDDHQLRYADQLGPEVRVLRDLRGLPGVIDALPLRTPKAAMPPGKARDRFVEELAGLVDAVVSRRRRG